MSSSWRSKIDMVFCSILREALVSSYVFFCFPSLWPFRSVDFFLQTFFFFKLCLLFPNLWVGRLWPRPLQTAVSRLNSLEAWVEPLSVLPHPRLMELCCGSGQRFCWLLIASVLQFLCLLPLLRTHAVCWSHQTVPATDVNTAVDLHAPLAFCSCYLSARGHGGYCGAGTHAVCPSHQVVPATDAGVPMGLLTPLMFGISCSIWGQGGYCGLSHLLMSEICKSK